MEVCGTVTIADDLPAATPLLTVHAGGKGSSLQYSGSNCSCSRHRPSPLPLRATALMLQHLMLLVTGVRQPAVQLCREYGIPALPMAATTRRQ